LAAINNTLGNAQQAENDLSNKDALMQEQKAQTANNTIWNVGDKYRQLEDIRDKQKMAIQQQAAALENAATANKQTGINDAIGGVEQGASQLFKKGDGTDRVRTQISSITPAQTTQLPSGGGMSAYGLAAYPYTSAGFPQMAQPSQDYTSGSYVPINKTASNYNWLPY
jgi:hypothetical protein